MMTSFLILIIQELPRVLTYENNDNFDDIRNQNDDLKRRDYGEWSKSWWSDHWQEMTQTETYPTPLTPYGPYTQEDLQRTPKYTPSISEFQPSVVQSQTSDIDLAKAAVGIVFSFIGIVIAGLIASHYHKKRVEQQRQIERQRRV
jgi:hypothetical protein